MAAPPLPPLPQPLAPTAVATAANDVAGGMFAAVNGGGPVLSAYELAAEQAAALTPQAHGWGGGSPAATKQRHALNGFDGRPLGATSDALDARCQSSVDELLGRSGEEKGPRLYADPLDGVRVAPLNSTSDVRIVYLIGIGARPFAHLVASRLLYALYSPTHLFLLHIDVKASTEAAEAMYALERQHANVRVLQARRLVQWGMWSMVAIMLDAVHTLLSSQLPFDFLINLSDADLALRTDGEMRDFLSRHKGRSFINVHGEGGEQLRGATAFINSHVVVECGGYGFVVVNHTHESFPLTHGCCIGRSGPAAFATLPIGAHAHIGSRSVHTGSQWAILSASFVRHLLHGPGSQEWLAAFERRLVPDESMLQTMAMHSPEHRASLVNHNLRWIDWPHSHGDPTEYWNALGARKFIGGPRVLNSSELSPVFASPYMFARKVDHEVDPHVLRLWDAWFARKRAGEDFSSRQAPIGHSPGDPGLSLRFRAPGHEDESRGRGRRRRIARVDFDDGSHCGCGDACGALEGGCCARSTCKDEPSGGDDAASTASDAAGSSAGVAACPEAEVAEASQPGGAPLTVSWVNRARYPIAISVLDYEGREHQMRVLRHSDEVVSFSSAEGIQWRARALNGQLLLRATPEARPEAVDGDAAAAANGTAVGSALVEVEECAFRWRGAASLVARGATGTLTQP